MANFAYFNKPINECSDKELIGFYVAFCDCADPNNEQDQKDYVEFKRELSKRDKVFQEIIAEIDSII